MRLKFILLCLLISTVAMAQDVIITNYGKKIDARIVEVAKDHIKFQELDNLNGAVFALKTVDISSIIYSNGKVVLYNNEGEEVQHSTNNQKVVWVENTSDAPTETVDKSDIILTKDGNCIQAKVIYVNSAGIVYSINDERKELGAEYIDKVIYANGEIRSYSMDNSENVSIITTTKKTNHIEQKTIYTASEFRGNVLPRFSYQKVNVPGKKFKKRRYVGGNMVLTEKEFVKLCEMYCPEAYQYYHRAVTFVVWECVCMFIFPLGVFIFAALVSSNFSNVLPTYNASCAARPVTELHFIPDYFHDQIPISDIHIANQ